MARSVGQHHGNLRPALLGAALEILAEGSLATLSLRAVARRAGVSPAAVYHHFIDKRALLVAVADDGFRGLHEALEQAGAVGAEDRLAEMSANYVRFAVAHAAHYQVMFDPSLGADPTTNSVSEPSELERSARAAFGTLVAAVEAVEPKGASKVAVVAWALAHGAVQLVVAGLSPQLEPEMGAEGMARAVGEAVVKLARG